MDTQTLTGEPITAAILVVGDEILSGRTKDKNVGYIAEMLTGVGIDVREVRVVPDIEAEIVAAVNALRERYTYVFSTGGIGPTHDDITADSMAAAFGVGIDFDPRAVEILTQKYGKADLTEGRMRMARIPDGAALIANPVSAAPGFTLGNVHVMAGVPHIMQAMLDAVLPTLRTGVKTLAETVSPGPGIGEGIIAAPLAKIAAEHAAVTIGSYPTMTPAGYETHLVIRGKDRDAVMAARRDVEAMVADVQARRATLPAQPERER